MGSHPRAPASVSVSDFSDTPATPMGGCGCWYGLMWNRRAMSSWGSGMVKLQYLDSYRPGLGSSHICSTRSMAACVMIRWSPVAGTYPKTSKSPGKPPDPTPQ